MSVSRGAGSCESGFRFEDHPRKKYHSQEKKFSTQETLRRRHALEANPRPGSRCFSTAGGALSLLVEHFKRDLGIERVAVRGQRELLRERSISVRQPASA